jgi:transposase
MIKCSARAIGATLCPKPYSPELNPIENVWAYLRSNKLVISGFDTYEAILEKCAQARNFFANDPEQITSITKRDWVKVNY